MASSSPCVLVTGASGRIGQVLIPALVAKGYSVRALTTGEKAPDPSSQVEWRRCDWMQPVEFDALVTGCDAVLHLGATVWDVPKMQRVNIDATRWLAEAAQCARVRHFGFTSSIAVYGSAASRVVTEETPVATHDRDIPGEFRANASFRAYGRSKVAGELVIRQVAGLEAVIFRPTIVAHLSDIVQAARDSSAVKAINAPRYTHFVAAGDVVAALIWAMERSLARPRPVPGATTYILADESPDRRKSNYAAFFRQMARKSGDASLMPKLQAPMSCYNLIDMAKNRQVSTRNALGAMHFSNGKLLADGFVLRTGIEAAIDQAALALSAKS